MRAWTAFTRKELLEAIRTGKLAILTVIFILFGIMNPAIAKITPWLMETMAGSLADTGLTVTAVKVDAMTSWTQFYKNIPMAIIIFLLMFGSSFTQEYQKGTLVNILTKGLGRWKVLAAKAFVMLLFWSAGYWMCYGITYGYTMYFWDNSVASDLGFAAFCVYLFGVWIISVVILASAFAKTNTAVLAAAGSGFGVVYLLTLFHDIQKYIPAWLLSSAKLLTGTDGPEEYLAAVGVALLLIVLNFAAAVVAFNKRAI